MNRSALLPGTESAACAPAQHLHTRLALWNRQRLAPQGPPADWNDLLETEHRMRRAEVDFVEAERRQHGERARSAPRDAHAFMAWFAQLEHTGPGQNDPLFPWLADDATLDQMRYFIEQEAASEAGFDDLVAMVQVKAPSRAKLELARNYWDEMGRGNAKGMHGPMLDALADAIGAQPDIATTAPEPLALANMMTALATHRAYAYQALGALGVIELTAPGRAAHVGSGLKRLGVSSKARHYFDLHAVLDVKHFDAWNREVIGPIVADRPEAARWIAEGALLRLKCGADCFGAYRRCLRVAFA